MKNLKIMSLFLAAVSMSFAVAAAEAAKLVPGAALFVYEAPKSRPSQPGILTRPAKDAEPVTATVDNAKSFSKGNLRRNKDTQKLLNQNVFMIWKGYIQVPEDGTYTFSASFARRTNFANNVIFQLGGKELLTISHIKDSFKMNDSRSAALAKGTYEVTVIFRTGNNGDFSIQMWNKKTPLKKINITPASFVHAE